MVTHCAPAAALLLSLPALASAASYDVVVYDASSGGVMAAVAASRHGAKTALLCASWPACFPEGGRIIGGMSGGGLGQTDIGGHTEIIGGLALEFYERALGFANAHNGGSPDAVRAALHATVTD